ncbi:MAG TPA: hypothetical protein VM511_05680 [Luteolibacter sp.]|nr:hypothetical protein [Luteolibacter sp.]
MSAVFKVFACLIPLVCASCVTERVVDDGNEATRLIEEESSSGFSR